MSFRGLTFTVLKRIGIRFLRMFIDREDALVTEMVSQPKADLNDVAAALAGGIVSHRM
jgi:hypothetical protein